MLHFSICVSSLRRGHAIPPKCGLCGYALLNFTYSCDAKPNTPHTITCDQQANISSYRRMPMKCKLFVFLNLPRCQLLPICHDLATLMKRGRLAMLWKPRGRNTTKNNKQEATTCELARRESLHAMWTSVLEAYERESMDHGPAWDRSGVIGCREPRAQPTRRANA